MSGERVDYGVDIVGAFSSIHLLGLFSTTIFLPALAPSSDAGWSVSEFVAVRVGGLGLAMGRPTPLPGRERMREGDSAS